MRSTPWPIVHLFMRHPFVDLLEQSDPTPNEGEAQNATVCRELLAHMIFDERKEDRHLLMVRNLFLSNSRAESLSEPRSKALLPVVIPLFHISEESSHDSVRIPVERSSVFLHFMPELGHEFVHQIFHVV
mmetsp:Transcript_3752/g.23611  ORF Transcript_3752/g.23611 Transcript_3752/m.23611 type:complete len:130 (+) Transcript_3752:1221-1610(+)